MQCPSPHRNLFWSHVQFASSAPFAQSLSPRCKKYFNENQICFSICCSFLKFLWWPGNEVSRKPIFSMKFTANFSKCSEPLKLADLCFFGPFHTDSQMKFIGHKILYLRKIEFSYHHKPICLECRNCDQDIWIRQPHMLYYSYLHPKNLGNCIRHYIAFGRVCIVHSYICCELYGFALLRKIFLKIISFFQ